MTEQPAAPPYPVGDLVDVHYGQRWRSAEVVAAGTSGAADGPFAALADLWGIDVASVTALRLLDRGTRSLRRSDGPYAWDLVILDAATSTRIRPATGEPGGTLVRQSAPPPAVPTQRVPPMRELRPVPAATSAAEVLTALTVEDEQARAAAQRIADGLRAAGPQPYPAGLDLVDLETVLLAVGAR